MPHKKAKRSVRDEQRRQQGSNLAPGKESIANEAIPKSAVRVLNALKIREDHRRKRKLKQGDGSQSTNVQKRRKTEESELKIKSGESIQHFYRRVEDDMRPLVRSAVQASKAVERKARNDELEAQKQKKEAQAVESRISKPKTKDSRGQSPPPLPLDAARLDLNRAEKSERPKEFEKFSTSAPRRLNDVAQAPPEIKKLPRGAAKAGDKREGVLSMAQKSMMEQEREKAIARYRLLKASRLRSTEP